MTTNQPSLLSSDDLLRERIATEHRLDAALEALDQLRSSPTSMTDLEVDDLMATLRECAVTLNVLRQLTGVAG